MDCYFPQLCMLLDRVNRNAGCDKNVKVWK